MSTTTPRLLLVKPDVSDSIAPFDSQVGSAYEALDLNFGAKEVASLAGSGFVGEVVKNNTGGDYRRWNGSKWQFCGHPTNYADSFETFNQDGTRYDVTGGAEEIIMFADLFTVVQNRRYMIRFCGQMEYNTSTSGFINAKIRLATGGGIVGTGDTLLRQFRYFVDSNGFFSKSFSGFYEYLHSAATTTASFGLFAQAETAVDFHVGGTSGSGGSDLLATSMTINDIGV